MTIIPSINATEVILSGIKENVIKKWINKTSLDLKAWLHER